MIIKRLLFVFVICYRPVSAMDTLFIAPENYSIDHHHHLIVVNRALSEINANSDWKDNLFIDEYYNFAQPINHFVVGQAYDVLHNNTGQHYQLYFTELPLVDIHTTTPIVDEPAQLARLTLTESNGSHI